MIAKSMDEILVSRGKKCQFNSEADNSFFLSFPLLTVGSLVPTVSHVTPVEICIFEGTQFLLDFS